MSANQSVPIVVAAGGMGRRMDGNKPMRALDGVSLIAIALTRAHSMSAKVAVAVQEKPSWAVQDSIELLYDDRPDTGPLSALSSALQWGRKLRAPHVLLMPCDMPFLPDDMLSRFADGIGDAAVAMAKSRTRLHPICALWSVAALSALPDYARNSRRSLIGFAEKLGMVETEWPAEDFDPFFNINTIEDLADAQRQLASDVVAI